MEATLRRDTMPKHTQDTRLVTILLIIVGAVVIVPMFAMGFGMMGVSPMMGGTWDGHMGDGYMWGGGAMPGWMFILGVVLQLLFLAAIIGGGYLIYKEVVGTENDTDQALEELRMAYARGDLSDDEYERRRETLQRERE